MKITQKDYVSLASYLNIVVRPIKIFLISLLILFVFRRFLFRLTVKYSIQKERGHIELVDENLIKLVVNQIEGKELNFEGIVKVSLRLVSEILSFSQKKLSNNPNELLIQGRANCVGYSALFNSIFNLIAEDEELQQHYISKHFVGKIYFLGMDITGISDNSFWRDHDFNKVENLVTVETIYLDPTIFDYIRIDRISAN